MKTALRWASAVALLAAVGGYAFRDEIALRLGAYDAARAQTSAAPPAPKPPSITVATAKRREIAQTLVVTGTLVARDEILVGAQIDGLRLDEYLVDIGDRVEKGQVLARLDRDMLDTQLVQNDSSIARSEAAIAQVGAAIAEAEASQVDADAALKRAETLVKTGNVTGEVLQTRQTAVRVAEARVRAQNQNLKVAQSDKTLAQAQRREIELRLARAEVRAPAAGIVASRTARVGQIVGMAGEPLFRLVRDGEVELEAEATETRLHSVDVGQTARVEVAGVDDAVEGRVRLVAPIVDPATRLGKVKIALPADRGLRPGLFARGLIETARREGVVVPQSAVLFGPDGPHVQVAADGMVSERAVVTGLQDADGVEITSGLKAGDAVVARAGGFLREGDRITAVAAPDRSADAADGRELTR
ncbi:MAG TPA: efflux RND transporter periplasmic adaptor subunit [Hansschlegelia sp.]